MSYNGQKAQGHQEVLDPGQAAFGPRVGYLGQEEAHVPGPHDHLVPVGEHGPGPGGRVRRDDADQGQKGHEVEVGGQIGHEFDHRDLSGKLIVWLNSPYILMTKSQFTLCV